MDKRFFLALFLSLIVIAISQLLFPPPKQPAAAKASGANQNSATSSTRTTPTVRAMAIDSSRGSSLSIERTSSTAPSSTSSSAVVAQATVVETSRAVYTFTNEGAAPTSVVIRDYQNRSTGGPVDLGTPGLTLLRYYIVTNNRDTLNLAEIPFQLQRSRTASGDDVLNYTASTANVALKISYTIPQDTAASYVVQVHGEVTGLQGPAYLLTELPRTLKSAEADTIADHRSLAYSFKPQKDHSRSVLFGGMDPGEKRLETGPLSWVAVKNKYFVMGILSPVNGVPFSEVSLAGGARTSKIATTASATVVDEIRNGSFAFDIYAGPQESQRLMRLGRDFDHVNPYGWRFLQGVVHPIASKVIQALLWMHHRLNLTYGWVLVILGILVRLALWPLNQSTMRSSLRMQELQPKLAAAQKKYKDPVQQREAIMKVYHDAGVSPFAGLTGCLPALLPMPILFALFFVFQNTIEFRGVPFLWLHDISIKDPLYILPLLMGASMYVLSWIGMRNAPPNPQAKMMGYMFPVMMTVVLLNMASGLNLYYTAQNIAALPQQWLLARERAKVRPGTT
jgi:YidC/Oxa1 family membrane protein insertase